MGSGLYRSASQVERLSILTLREPIGLYAEDLNLSFRELHGMPKGRGATIRRPEDGAKCRSTVAPRPVLGAGVSEQRGEESLLCLTSRGRGKMQINSCSPPHPRGESFRAARRGIPSLSDSPRTGLNADQQLLPAPRTGREFPSSGAKNLFFERYLLYN